jgi:hypothetical protein
MRQVWIPGAQSMVKRFIRSCVPCFRFRPRHGGQLMGQLPSSRVTPARPFSREVASTLAQDGTTWSFIPPYTPHFGGLWEAGVKSVKSLLLKAIGPRTLTFEEMTTYLAQVEACLNSRPLTPLSSDASDITALTPAHFLLGSTLGLVPEPPIDEDPSKLLVRWRQVQQAQQCFWRRWSLQYLNHLQQRSRWRSATVNFAVGQLVLVHDHRCPPAKWILGRVTATHPGADGLVRVVTVRTANSECRRPITKLSPLPL